MFLFLGNMKSYKCCSDKYIWEWKEKEMEGWIIIIGIFCMVSFTVHAPDVVESIYSYLKGIYTKIFNKLNKGWAFLFR